MTEYKDLRSAAADNKRMRTRRAKYHNFATANEGQLNAPHYISTHPYSPFRNHCIFTPAFGLPPSLTFMDVTSPDDVKLVPALTKREVFDIAQAARLCNHHGPCPDRKSKWSVRNAEARRGTKAAKKAARNWRDEWHDDACLDGVDSMYREVEHYRDWDGIGEIEDPSEVCHPFDVAPLLYRAEEEWRDEEKRLMVRLGWVDAWDDENWRSDVEDAWSDVDGNEL